MVSVFRKSLVDLKLWNFCNKKKNIFHTFDKNNKGNNFLRILELYTEISMHLMLHSFVLRWNSLIIISVKLIILFWIRIIDWSDYEEDRKFSLLNSIYYKRSRHLYDLYLSQTLNTTLHIYATFRVNNCFLQTIWDLFWKTYQVLSVVCLRIISCWISFSQSQCSFKICLFRLWYVKDNWYASVKSKFWWKDPFSTNFLTILFVSSQM